MILIELKASGSKLVALALFFHGKDIIEIEKQLNQKSK